MLFGNKEAQFVTNGGPIECYSCCVDCYILATALQPLCETGFNIDKRCEVIFAECFKVRQRSNKAELLNAIDGLISILGRDLADILQSPTEKLTTWDAASKVGRVDELFDDNP